MCVRVCIWGAGVCCLFIFVLVVVVLLLFCFGFSVCFDDDELMLNVLRCHLTY